MKERPISTLIFGILNIGFGLLKLAAPLLTIALSKLKMPGNAAVAGMTSDPAYAALTQVNLWTGTLFGLALVGFGIGLLLLQNWARLGSIIYAVVDIVFVLIMSMLMWPLTKRLMEQMPGVPRGMMVGFGMLGMAVGLFISLTYPLLLLFFMTRGNVIEACQRPEPAAPA